jgi:hypothetical protein
VNFHDFKKELRQLLFDIFDVKFISFKSLIFSSHILPTTMVRSKQDKLLSKAEISEELKQLYQQRKKSTGKTLVYIGKKASPNSRLSRDDLYEKVWSLI